MSRAALRDFGITLVRPGFYWWSGVAMLGVLPGTVWSRKFEPDELDRLRLGQTCYVIRTGGHLILVETSAGNKPDPSRCTSQTSPGDDLGEAPDHEPRRDP